MLVQINIDFTNQRKINFAPKTVLEEIVQNVENIWLLIKGEVPYQRDIGIDTTLIDQPIFTAMMMFQLSFAEQLDKFEPRAEARSFDWSDSDLTNGYLKVKVTISINERLL